MFPAITRKAVVVPLFLAGTMLSACSADTGLGGVIGFGSDDNSVTQNDLRTTIPYEVEITGVDPQEEILIAALENASTARRLQSRPTASRAG